MRVLITGSRGWVGARLMADVIASFPEGTTFLHGKARGADEMGGEIALKLGYSVEEYPAEWSKYGRKAGYLRNIAMLDTKPDEVIAFWDGKSKGTKHTFREAQKRGIPTHIYERK